MDMIWQKITEWLKEVLVGGILDNLSGMFDNVNQKVAEIAGQVGTTPAAWNGNIFSMVRNLSETVILPIAGVILAFVMTYELIQMVIDKNNMNDFDTWIFFKWIFKTFCAVLIVTNTWNIVMAVFDVAQTVVNGAAGVIVGNASIDITTAIADLEARLMEMDIGPLFGLWFQSLSSVYHVGFDHLHLHNRALRMTEIYLHSAAHPTAQQPQGQMRSYLLLMAWFPAFLIIVCFTNMYRHTNSC